MNLVDSSGWLEYFADGPNAGFFAAAIENTRELVVPTVVLLEVFKRILQQRDETAALLATGQLKQGAVVALDSELALTAAKLGHDLGLPLADSVIYATARRHQATLWTQDRDFDGLDGVRFTRKA
jgi:toxin FitB